MDVQNSKLTINLYRCSWILNCSLQSYTWNKIHISASTSKRKAGDEKTSEEVMFVMCINLQKDIGTFWCIQILKQSVSRDNIMSFQCIHTLFTRKLRRYITNQSLPERDLWSMQFWLWRRWYPHFPQTFTI